LVTIVAFLMALFDRPQTVAGDRDSHPVSFYTGSEWAMLTPEGHTFSVRVLRNDGVTVTFQMPLGTLDIPLQQIRVVSLQEKLIRIY
jgi:hypothetical protein